MGTISKLSEGARKYITDDIRKIHKCVGNQLSLINEISSRYELDKGLDSPQTKENDLKFGEPVIPTRLRRWAADISQISAYIAPDQAAENVFAMEFHLSESKGPPFTPLVCPDISNKPRCIPLVSHERPRKTWEASVSRKHKESPHQIRLQRWMLYAIRFLLAGDMIDA